MKKKQILIQLELAKELCAKHITCEPDIEKGISIAIDFFKKHYMSDYDLYPHHSFRDEMLFGDHVDWTQVKGIKRFKNIKPEVFEQFDIYQSQNKVRFYNAGEKQNDSPTIDDFYDFMWQFEGFKAYGYCRRPSSAPSIVIEGLEYHYKDGEPEDQTLVDALEDWCYKVRNRTWKAPNQFVANDKVIRCWWD